MKKRTKLIILPAIMGVIFYCFFIQPEILGISISKSINFPLGSFISWGGVVVYTLLAQLFVVNQSKSILFKYDQIFRRVQLIFALTWLPVSFALSGNLLFAFQNRPHAFKFWIYYTLVILFLPVVLILIKLFSKAEK